MTMTERLAIHHEIEEANKAHLIEFMHKAGKNYRIIWDNGFKCRIHVNGGSGAAELEALGFWFDDFCDDGTGDEIWKH